MIKMLVVLIFINILLSAYWLLEGDIHYDVDVSRDLLVIDDIVRNRHFTLLGPRSGAIPGIFHGPLWFYVNLPAFLIGGGNPLVVGWFWLFLSIIFLLVVYWVAMKLFNLKTALLSTLFLSVNSIINPSIGLKNFYNPYGAIFLSPLFLYSFYRFVITVKVRYLILSLFILGLIIQFQMAFGLPILLLTSLFLIYFLFKKRKFHHFLAFFILLIPLSTFIIFDIKHDGLQYHALLQYLQESNKIQGSFISKLGLRLNEFIYNFFDLISPGKNIITLFSTLFFLTAYMRIFRKSSGDKKTIYFLFGYLFLGFWVISLFYKGGVGNYFWPFLPLAIIIFCSFYKVINNRFFIPIFILLYIINLYTGISAILNFKTDISKRGPHSWAFNLSVAKNIYEDAKGDFGYFTFSPDRFAYQQRYAMTYTSKLFPAINAFSSTKKPLTYLIEVDPPQDRPDLNGTNWRISDVKIDRQPNQTFRFDFVVVEKYLLNNKEVRIQANPDLLDSVFIR